jgi:predicted nucleic acid-binding Zn ribbon protein
MPTYVYETIPSSEDETPERFEIRQSMRDTPLSLHPESGRPVRRIISGGYGFLKVRSGPALPTTAASPPSNCCPTCHD